MRDRGLSVTVNYVLGLAIATLLLSSLLFAVGDIVGDQRDAAARSELEVVGERVAAGLGTADRLAGTGADTVVVELQLPRRVAGSDYRIETDGGAETITLETTDGEASATVEFESTKPVADSTVDGGVVEVTLTAVGELEVRSA